MKTITITALALSALLAAGCGEMNEQQKLESLRSSPLSASYQFTSDKAVKLAVSRYGNGRINEKTAHGLLGLLWLVKDKPKLACMEADAFSEMNKGRADNLSLAIRTVAFRRMNWTELSGQEYGKLKANLAEEKKHAGAAAPLQTTASAGPVLVAFNQRDGLYANDGDTIRPLLDYTKIKADQGGNSSGADDKDYKMALLGQILVGLDRHDDAIAMESAKAFDALGGGGNMMKLVEIAAKARDGNIELAKQKLDQIRNRKGLSEQKKAMLDNLYNILMQFKPGTLSEENLQQLANTLANSVISDVFKGSRLGAILNRL